jgi:hypothetical protein
MHYLSDKGSMAHSKGDKVRKHTTSKTRAQKSTQKKRDRDKKCPIWYTRARKCTLKCIIVRKLTCDVRIRSLVPGSITSVPLQLLEPK